MPELMTPLEVLMWRAGAAPDLRPDFASVTVLARPPRRARLRQALSQAATMLPTLRRTVRATGWPLGRHEWVDDADFDVDHHIREVSAPGSGQRGDLLELVAQLSADPLPGDGPSWEVVVVDGLDGGGAAVVQRLHHSIADGVDAVRLWRRLLADGDSPGRSTGRLARSATLNGSESRAGSAARDGSAGSGLAARAGGPTATALDPFVGAARQSLESGLSIGRTAARAGIDAARTVVDPHALARGVGAVGTLLDPRSLADGVGAASHLADELRAQVVTGGQLSPLMRERSIGVDLDVLSVPLDELRESARARSVGPNDALVAGVAAALGDYHHRLGHDCDELRFAVPVRRGRGAPTARNGFTPMRFVLPVTPPRGDALLPAVAKVLGRARRSPALALTEPLAAALNLLPTPLLVGTLRNQSRTVDAAVSLVVGLRGAPSLAGAPIEATFPFGPRLGAALNVTALPMGDRLDIGINIDPVAVTEHDVLMSCLQRSFEQIPRLLTARHR